jgi:signal transduction histidine kinase
LKAQSSWSLQRRLMLTLGAATALAWSVGSAWQYRLSLEESGRLADQALDHTAHAVLAVVRNEAAEMADQEGAIAYEISAVDPSDPGSIVYQVLGPHDIMVFRSQGAPHSPFGPSAQSGFADREVDGRGYRVYTLSTDRHLATIEVAQPMDRRTELARTDALYLLAPGAVLALVLVAAVTLTVRRITTPVIRFAAALDARAPQDELPVDAQGLPRELEPVVRSIRSLLDRVHYALLHERTLTADAAHELRTPLAALRLQAQVARRARDPQERDALLMELQAGVDRAARMVEVVLALARYDALPQQGLTLETVDPGRLGRIVLREYAAAASQRGISLEAVDGDQHVLGDEDALAIALRNLLENALRHASSRILVSWEDQPDGSVLLAVRDDGPGFDASAAQRAFDRFFRGNTATRSAGSSGLGLALVQRVARLHGGTARIVEGLPAAGGGHGGGVGFVLRACAAPESVGPQD